MKVCVVGAGVIGLSSALAIQQRVPNARVTIVADRFDQDTTSHGAGGLIVPFVQNVPEHIGNQWCGDSIKHFYDLAFSAQGYKAGVFLVSGYELSNDKTHIDKFKYSLNINKVDAPTLQRFGGKYKYGHSMTVPMVEVPLYLKWLAEKFKAGGGILIKHTVQSLQELQGQYNLVVNCTGLANRHLVQDSMLQPARGQTIHLKAPWIKDFVLTDDNAQVFPHTSRLFVGGVKQIGNTDPNLSATDRESIMNKITALFPSLKDAEIIFEWVGFRPERDNIRLEEETLYTDKGKPLRVIHNYGHGSLGISLSWGCAIYAAKLAEKFICVTGKL